MSPRCHRRSADDPSHQPVSVQVRCSNALHTITWDGNRLIFDAHSYRELRFQVAMDNDCRCSRVFQFIHNLYSTRHGFPTPQYTGFAPPEPLSKALHLYRYRTRPERMLPITSLAEVLHWKLRPHSIKTKYAPVNRALKQAGFDAKIVGGRWPAVNEAVLPILRMPTLTRRPYLQVGRYADGRWQLVHSVLGQVLRFTNGATGEPGIAWGSAQQGCRVCQQGPGEDFDPRTHAYNPDETGHLSTAIARLTAILGPIEFSDLHPHPSA
jgi:hypothetical protein